LKAVTYLVGSPDEVAHALLDEKQRMQWDPRLRSFVKTAEDTFKATYGDAVTG